MVLSTTATTNKCNIMMIGDGAVGKTSLLKMYSESVFGESHMATLGLDYVTKTYEPPGDHSPTEGGIKSSGAKMQVKIWDTAG